MVKTFYFEKASPANYMPMFEMMVKSGEKHKCTVEDNIVNGKIIDKKERPRPIMVPDKSNKGLMIPYQSMLFDMIRSSCHDALPGFFFRLNDV